MAIEWNDIKNVHGPLLRSMRPIVYVRSEKEARVQIRYLRQRDIRVIDYIFLWYIFTCFRWFLLVHIEGSNFALASKLHFFGNTLIAVCFNIKIHMNNKEFKDVNKTLVCCMICQIMLTLAVVYIQVEWPELICRFIFDLAYIGLVVCCIRL
ncbi:uncharacterized protein LOC109829563 [Asparagus officinalis]|uniref:uncharacterized protein LOC109829563 n=1 Tax=Asparagus officinalis TaxID=4686 RepID=UPI00098E10D1|nr:uncharacterized protein LOC109829563 [Asparagus officinalis]